MHFLAILVKVLLALLSVTMISYTVYDERKDLKFVLTIWSRFRALMFIEVCGAITQTILIYYVLATYCPWLNYGWLSLFLGKNGNLFVAPVMEASHINITWVKFLPIFFFAILTVAIPFLARVEEKMFRSAYIDWPDIIRQSVIFGLIHCLVGVPPAAGIGLISAGLFYGYKYRRAFFKDFRRHGNVRHANDEALLVSITYHTLYNTVLIALMALASLLIALN